LAAARLGRPGGPRRLRRQRRKQLKMDAGSRSYKLVRAAIAGKIVNAVFLAITYKSILNFFQ
jgi:hypothetical protein